MFRRIYRTGGRPVIHAALRLAALALALLAAPAARAEAPLTVFAAASLTNAFDEAAALYAKETGTELRVSYAGSSALARQIDRGAPADLFLSANADWMDWLEDRGRLLPGSRRDLLRNRLVLVAHGEAPEVTLSPGLDLRALLDGGRLAMAFVDAVPAGIYGKAALSSLGLWAQAEPHVAQADNVRAALALVARGEAPFGIVYATDVAAEPAVSVVATFPADSHPPIVYPGAVPERAERERAAALLDWLAGPQAQAVFARHGFAPLSD
ncbi:MAG: molybdate ABC transporter substrate-binding protein [Pseudomonadota bacterium]